MMMSSPFLFGQHWEDPGNLGYQNSMTVYAQVMLDNVVQTNDYQVAAFHGDQLLAVSEIIPFQGTTSNYHVHLQIYGDNSMGNIYFKFFNGTKEYVSETEFPFEVNVNIGDHPNYSTINFYSVAQIGNVVYPSLQEAIDAAANGDVVTLLKDNEEDVTVVQAPNVAFTIEGAEKTMSGTITVNGKSAAYATAGLTIKNVNFDATNIADASIMLGVSGDNNTRYTNGVTVQDCDFEGNGQTKVAIKNYTGGCKNLTVTGGTFTGLHSLMQVKGVDGLTITGVTVEESGRGISVGTSTNVAISNSTFDVNSYGVRADGGAYTMTLTNNNISAELPVVVRKAEEFAYNLTIAGDNNTFTAKQQGNNPEGYQVVFTTGDDGTYLAPTTGQFVLSVPENFNVYPVYVAQVGNLKYTSVNAALTAAQTDDIVQIFAGTYNQALNINKDITVVGERNDQDENLVNITGKLNITANNATAKNLNVNNGNGNGAYINAKDVTVDGCKVVGGNGFRNCYTTGLVTFKNSTITGSTYGIHFDGSAGGEIVIDNCVITGWTSFARTITKVSMKGTSFKEGNYNYVRFYQNEVVIEDCTFNENMAIDIAVDGNTTTIDDCTFTNGNIEDLFEDKDIVNSTIIVDGITLKREASIGNTYYETLAEAFAAAQNGNEVKILVAGTYALSTSGKNITITGAVDGVVFDNIGAKNMGGANVTFNNVTFDYYPNGNYTGLQHSGNLTYNNCTINGQVFLYGTSETFNNCTFNQNSADAYNVWTYGAAQVAFNECTFNSAGKSVLIYTESATTFNTVTVTDCDFIASAPVEGKAAIEMDSSLSAGINLTIDGETTVNNFGSGNVSNNSLWNNKNGNETEANNDITVVVNNVTVLEPWAPVAKIGETPYETLAKAISAATAGQTITICSDVNENVTINKNLTIDGGDNNYTGTMTGNAGLNVTVQNLNFVNAWFDKSSKSTTGTYIFKNCSFDGYNATQNYAFRFKGANSVTIENCTVKDYLYSFLYVTSSTATVNIKDVTVEDCPSYGVRFSSGVTNTSIENLTVKNSNNGFVINNTANRTLNLKNCTFENVTTAINHTNGTNTVKCNLSGENDFGTSALSEYATIVLEAADAKLTAKEGLNNVTTTVEGCVVKYEAGETPGFGTYSVVAANVELVRGETSVGKFATIQDAIDAAQENDKIVVLKDVDLSTNECVLLDNSYNTYFKVEGKTVTVDLNDMTISGEYASSPMLVGVFSTDNNGHLTLEDSSDEKTGAVNVTTAEGYTVYSLIANYEPGCSITINDGTYTLDKAHDSHIYSGSTNGETEGVTVNGGVFKLGNVGTGLNGKPWMFNVLGSNDGNVVVNGGTFDADINHQFWANEVYVPETKALQNNGDEERTWKVVESVAYVEETATSTNARARNVGYATIEDAIEAIGIRNTNKTVTMLQDVVLENTITIAAGKEVILDLNGKTISGVCNSGQGHMFMVQNTADLTVKDSSENEEGKITYARGTSNTGWVIDLEGDLILESGTIELTGDSWSIGYAVDVRPNSWGSEYTEATTFTMKGGKLVSSDAAVRVASSNADDHENVSANFIMNGGEIEAAWDGIFVQQSNAAYDILNVRINGGNIKSAFSPLRLYGPAATSVLNNVENPITLNITGGTFDYTGTDLENEKWLVRGVIMVSGGATFEQMLEYTDFEITGGTFDGDVNAYCAKGFAAVNNGDGTWTVMPVQKQNLVKGWNWYSSYLDITTENLLGALGTNGKSIVQNSTWSATYYGVNDGTDYGWGYESHIFDVSKMYMIETSQACELALSGNLVDASEITITLNPGWNWIGYPSNVEVRLEDALDGLQPSHGDEIKTQGAFASYYDYEGQSMWLTYSFGNGNMKPTQGYMYNNTSGETKTFTYKIVPATTRGNNETEVATHYSVDYTKYPFNMTMTAVVDGAIGDNYEVAALVNGEVRGSARPVYVEVLDAYMLFLTISGDNVEEVSFKYYDLTTGEEYDLVNRIDYSNNAMVGSVNEPYVLSRGTTGIGDAAMSQVNIYPNPTTTGTEINLEAVCDTVEVFNALGVKVAEYQNVDSIDALETAGIYVIRITNDGNVQNCRLVVK